MANTYTTLNDLFTAIANSIRNKKNSTETIVADTFPTEIDNLRIGFDYNNLEVTSISDYAFYGWKDLNSVDCYNLTSIGVSAFENCTNLKSVILYEGVTTIDENAFKGCDNVIIYYKGSSIPETWHDNWNPDNRPVLFGEPIETWDVSATEADNVVAKLYGINDEYTLLVDGNGTMKNYTFSGNTVSPWRAYSNITSTIILDSVTSIGNYTFYKCSNLTSITIPDSVTSIGNNAFSGCKSLTFINIPDGVTNIGSYAFQNCTSLISAGPIGGNYNYEFGWTNKIPNYAFSSSSLTSITIPDSVTSIGNNAFYSCSNLRSINIPDGVTNIGSYAFWKCTSLTSIIYTGTITQWQAITFGNSWNDNTPDYTIHCTDGDIAKDGTITYH